ncbi:MAG: phage portal protein [Cetobacterium sp.]
MDKPIILKNEVNYIDSELVKFLIESFEKNKTRNNKLLDYYIGEHEILNTVKKSDKANNLIVNNYPAYITDIMTGYFIGKPINYLLEVKEENMIKTFNKVEDIFFYNNEQDVNYEICKSMSIYGSCYEIYWIDEKSTFRFKNINPSDMIIILNPDKIEDEIILACRIIKKEDKILKTEKKVLEIYFQDSVYVVNVIDDGFFFEEPKKHGFNNIPIAEYKNNDMRLGDFEGVISLTDGYNKLISEGLNEVEDFVNSYLVISGMSGTTKQDIEKAKSDRVILTEEGGNAAFISKTINNNQVQFEEKTIKENIHKFSKVVDLTDENFAGNSSGVAMEFKLWSLEQAAAIKERKFKSSIYKRIFFINEFLMKLDSNDENILKDIKINFNRNQPQNLKDIADIISTLSGKISDETLISLLPFVDNPSIEINKRDSELEGVDDYKNVTE